MCATDPQRACTAKILITRNEFISTPKPKSLEKKSTRHTERDTEREKERKLAELANTSTTKFFLQHLKTE